MSKSLCDIQSRLELRMEPWERGRIRALLDDVIAEVGRKPATRAS